METELDAVFTKYAQTDVFEQVFKMPSTLYAVCNDSRNKNFSYFSFLKDSNHSVQASFSAACEWDKFT